MFVKMLVYAAVLGLIGLLIGPFIGLAVMPFPAEACGMYWLIPFATGAVYGAVGGFALGCFAGLVI